MNEKEKDPEEGTIRSLLKGREREIEKEKGRERVKKRERERGREIAKLLDTPCSFIVFLLPVIVGRATRKREIEGREERSVV